MSDIKYPEGEEKINAPKTILRVGANRTGQAQGTIFEAEIQADAIWKVSRRFMNFVTMWRNNTGSFKIDNRFVRFGIPGQADVSGIIKPYGQRLEIEFKRPDRKQTAKQKKFETMIISHGGVYLLCDGDIEGQIIKPLEKIIYGREL